MNLQGASGGCIILHDDYIYRVPLIMRIDQIRFAARKFDDEKYPTEIYHHLIERIGEAKTPNELGEALSHAVAWKFGRVRRDPEGIHYIPASHIHYTVQKPLDRFFNDHQRQILYSEGFYEWASAVRDAQKFNQGLLTDQKGWLAALWLKKRILMRVFVLHCLCPRVYPSLDQMVIRAYNVAHERYQERLLSTSSMNMPTYVTYRTYRAWWFKLLHNARLDPRTSPLTDLKEINTGLWALGKKASLVLKQSRKIRTQEWHGLRRPGGASNAYIVYPKAFKQLAIEIYRQGEGRVTQSEAILEAAIKEGIELKPAVLKYSASYFGSWRKQKLWDQE